MNGMLVGAVVVPVVVGIFKSELMSLFTDWRIYRRKAVTEGGHVELLNPNTGEWGEVEVVDYTYGLQKADRVVTFKHCASGRVESVPFGVWEGFRKYVMP